MSTTWISSDFHYNHKNLVKGTTNWNIKDICRPFDNLKDHNDWIVDDINSKAKPNDTLYFLGDWSFGGIEFIEEFRNRVNVKTIHLILGNHDHHIERNTNNVRKHFTTVQNYLELDYNGTKVVLFHFPLETWHGLHRGSIHIFGHQHSDRVGKGRKMDVGFDAKGQMRGIFELDDIVDRLKSLPIIEGIGDSNIEVNIK